MQTKPADTPRALRALGEAVRIARLKRGHSQEALADLAEVHRNYIGRVERAEINLSFDTLHRIAAALRLTIADLAKRAGV